MDYVMLVNKCFGSGKMRAADRVKILSEWFPEETGALKKMRASDVIARMQDVAASRPELLRQLHDARPELFALPHYDLKEIFHDAKIFPTLGQVAYLGRHGRFTILGKRVSRTDGVTEICLYDPFEFETISDDDYNAPDIPDVLPRDMIRKIYGWSDKMIDTYLPAPEETKNPHYVGGPTRKRWRAEDIERIAKENMNVQVELMRLQTRRDARSGKK